MKRDIPYIYILKTDAIKAYYHPPITHEYGLDDTVHVAGVAQVEETCLPSFRLTQPLGNRGVLVTRVLLAGTPFALVQAQTYSFCGGSWYILFENQ